MPRVARNLGGIVALACCFGAMPVEAREKVVAYVPNWVDLAKFAETIDYAKVTHINIAFENPVNDLGDLSFNNCTFRVNVYVMRPG